MSRAVPDVVLNVMRRTSGLLERSAPLRDLLQRIPDTTALGGLPPGTPVWIRLDLDTPATGTALRNDPRVASASAILEQGRQRGWRMLLLSHRGSRADGTLRHVHEHLREATAGGIGFVVDWFDEAKCEFTREADAAIRRLEPGALLLFENTRRYAFEMRLRGVQEEELPAVGRGFQRICDAFTNVAAAYVNDAVATCNENFSTAVLPLAMGTAALGPFASRELAVHGVPASTASLVSCAGAKWNKLEHLLAIVKRGRVEVVLVGGSLAVAMWIASGRMAPHDQAPPQTVALARRVMSAAESRDVRLVLPVDFVLDDGSVVDRVPARAWPQDVGPLTRSRFDAEAMAWLECTRTPVAYANGVAGRFEDPRWAEGTQAMVATLVRLQRAGATVYVGGGEGRAALERYASVHDVHHAFTAGGTMLRILGGRPLPSLEALAARAAPTAR